jgi:hypothetical protein
MSSKTPYEIRSELISLAQHHLEQQYFANLEFARAVYQKSIEGMPAPNCKTVEEMVEFQKKMMESATKFLPAMPSMEEITKKATELYAFVSKRD